MNLLFFIKAFVLFYAVSISIAYILGDDIEHIKTLIVSFLFSLSFSIVMYWWKKKKS